MDLFIEVSAWIAFFCWNYVVFVASKDFVRDVFFYRDLVKTSWFDYLIAGFLFYMAFFINLALFHLIKWGW